MHSSSVFGKSRRTLAATILATFVLTACNEGSDGDAAVALGPDGEGNLSFAVPERLQQARNLNREELNLTVTVGDTAYEVEKNENGQYVLEARLPRNATTVISLNWTIDLAQGRLELAKASKDVYVAPDDTSKDVHFDYFNTNLDQDLDAYSNLHELEEGTDPFDPSSPGQPPALVNFNLVAQLPSELGSAPPNVLDALDVVLRVNGQELEETRDGNSWQAITEVAADSEPFIEVVVYANTNRQLKLATAEVTTQVGSGGGGYSVNAGNYFDDYNADGDQLTNVEEIVDGTNPNDSGDPPVPPCEQSQFHPDCDIDTDGDGKTDAQETVSADADGDGRPDYNESTRVDADGDGVNAELDAREDDPCIPQENNAACINNTTTSGTTGTTTSGTDTGSTTSGTDTGSTTSGTDTGSTTSGTDTGSTTSGTDTGSTTSGTDTGSTTSGTDTGSTTSGTDTGSTTSGTDTGSTTSGTDTGSTTSDTDTGSTTSGTDTGTTTSGTDTGSTTSGTDTGTTTSGTDTGTTTSGTDTGTTTSDTDTGSTTSGTDTGTTTSGTDTGTGTTTSGTDTGTGTTTSGTDTGTTTSGTPPVPDTGT